MVRWEYRVENYFGTPERIKPFLDVLGNEGWELVTVLVDEGPVFYFKRRVD